MNASIQISSSAVDVAPNATKGEVVKLVQGALLIAVAALPLPASLPSLLRSASGRARPRCS